MAICAEIGEIIEHLLDLLHIRFLVNRRVGRHLVAERLRHLDCKNALLEDAFALHNEIVCSLEAIEVHVPIHPARRSNGRLGRILWPFPNFRRVFLADQ